MRYLNKIVFINSAHVPYAEIKLDGNVHFIGTQGVGKSTLLRAILFFYNVDKSKLGIRVQGNQRSYDEFYLPHPNSYIVYEICRETGNFFVMTFLSRGRTAFRIVDCAYDKRFFVEDDGMVRSEWGSISEKIGHKVFKSNIIRGYEEFRDIIYGNAQNVAKELRRFSLLESTKYQNVPRTIQNIFLNQSLESRVIKDTIIDSMDFANDGIDLNLYREHLKMFQRQYEDIWKWYKRERNGSVRVKIEAEDVIAKYSLYENIRKEIAELCAQLNFAYGRDKALLPELAEQEGRLGVELERQRRLLSEEDRKYHDERDKLNQTEGAIKDFLKVLQKKRDHYATIGIEKIIERIGKEGELKIKQESLKHQESLLTDKNQEVKAKYDALIQTVENGLREQELQSQQNSLEIERELNNLIARQNKERQEQKDAIDGRFSSAFDENQEQMNIARKEESDVKLRENSVRNANPYSDQMAELKKSQEELLANQNSLTKQSADLRHQIESLTHETERECRELEIARDKDIAEIENRITALSAEISKLDELLSRQKGSLIDWLRNNVDGWEANIGKVVDEDTVLYNTQLNPKKREVTDTVFGVELDLENIDKSVRTPQMIEAEKAALESQVKDLQRQIANRRQKFEEEKAELERKPQAQLKKLRAEKLNVDVQLEQIPNQTERIGRELADFEEKLQAWRRAELSRLADEFAKVQKQIEALIAKKQDLANEKNKELEALRKSFEKQEKTARSEAEAKKKSLGEEIERKRQEAAREKAELTAQMDAELKGLGVDVNQLAEIRRQLQEISEELRLIEDKRSEYFSWQNDKRDYFDNEQSKKDELKQIRQKIDDLQQKFSNRKQRLDAEIARLSKEIDELKKRQETLQKSIEKVDGLKQSISCPAELLKDEQKETSRALAEIFDSLDADIRDQQRRMEDFKHAVDVFKSNFSAQNTFNFRTELNGTADYIDYAIDLNEFLSNNKIEEYRTRTSERYASIIQQIAREVSELDRHGSEIKETINEINKDFRDNNFAGVIKDIELRSVESNDRLMQQLLNIKHFDDENSFNYGQLDLFTNEATLGRTNEQAVRLLMTLVDQMEVEKKRDRVTLSDSFKLEFRVKENDQDTTWVEKLFNVGSDGTDILVKAMINIMLINVFKRKISRKFGDFKLHCMMDEIGKLHPNNVEGILKFANVRNIFLINSSPMAYNAQAYRYTYSLSKDENSNTVVKTLLTIR